jgi:hypothetical protein
LIALRKRISAVILKHGKNYDITAHDPKEMADRIEGVKPELLFSLSPGIFQ